MFLYAIAAIAAVVAVLLTWGILHLRHSHRVAMTAIQRLCVDEVPSLRDECEQVFLEKFGETLSLDDLERSARLLSDRLDDRESLKAAFARPAFYWYFVLPVGAYLGELLRVHAGGEWCASEEGGVEMRVPVAGGSATTYPFDKVLKQLTAGGRGDVHAYLMTAARLEEALADLSVEEG
jgi:hypothetical protein